MALKERAALTPEQAADLIAANYFEVVAAPDFEEGVLEKLAARKNLRIFKLPALARLGELAGRWVLLAERISSIFPCPMRAYPSWPSPVSMKSSLTSRKRTAVPLMAYSLSPDR